jgi:hypothetical protein
MATEHKDSTKTELADLKVHVLALSQAVMGLLQRLAQHPPQPQGPPGGMNPALMQRMAQIAAARRQQAMQGAPPGMPPQGGGPPPQMPPQRPPGMALGGLQMGLNRLEPMGSFNRGIAHALTPTHLNFHAPHMAMGGVMPGQMGAPMGGGIPARPPIHPALMALAQRYGMR